MILEILGSNTRHDLGTESGGVCNLWLDRGRGWIGESSMSTLGIKLSFLSGLDYMLDCD